MMELTKNSAELRNLILEHPDYPIVVLAGEEANGGDYSWVFCTDIEFSVTEILDCEYPRPWMSKVVMDRDDFEEELSDWLWGKMSDELNGGEPSEEDFEKRLTEEKEKYEPFWKNVIAIYATN